MNATHTQKPYPLLLLSTLAHLWYTIPGGLNLSKSHIYMSMNKEVKGARSQLGYKGHGPCVFYLVTRPVAPMQYQC